jgi:hypothetical protein
MSQVPRMLPVEVVAARHPPRVGASDSPELVSEVAAGEEPTSAVRALEVPVTVGRHVTYHRGPTSTARRRLRDDLSPNAGWGDCYPYASTRRYEPSRTRPIMPSGRGPGPCKDKGTPGRPGRRMGERSARQEQPSPSAPAPLIQLVSWRTAARASRLEARSSLGWSRTNRRIKSGRGARRRTSIVVVIP